MSQESVLSKSIIGKPLHATSIGNFNKKQSKLNISSGEGFPIHGIKQSIHTFTLAGIGLRYLNLGVTAVAPVAPELSKYNLFMTSKK